LKVSFGSLAPSHHRERQIANSAVQMRSIKNHQVSKLIEDKSRYEYRTRRIQESTLQDFVIYYDSLSSLESVEQLCPTRHPLLYQIQDVIFWVPGPYNKEATLGI
jgi:AAA15 family ATPase/GTPase